MVDRVAQAVEHGRERVDVRARGPRHRPVGREARDRGVRAQDVVVDRVERTVVADAVEDPVDRDHLAVEALEGPEPEVAVLAEGADADRTFVDALDERADGRHLEDRLVVDVEEVRERGRDQVPDRLAGLRAPPLERVPQPGRDAAPQLVAPHGSPLSPRVGDADLGDERFRLGEERQGAVEGGDAALEVRVVRRALRRPAGRPDRHPSAASPSRTIATLQLVGPLGQRGRELLDHPQHRESLAGADRIAEVDARRPRRRCRPPRAAARARARSRRGGRCRGSMPGPGRGGQRRCAREPALPESLQRPEAAGAGVTGAPQLRGELGVRPVLLGELLAQRGHPRLQVRGRCAATRRARSPPPRPPAWPRRIRSPATSTTIPITTTAAAMTIQITAQPTSTSMR